VIGLPAVYRGGGATPTAQAYKLSIINYQLSIINYQFFSRPGQRRPRCPKTQGQPHQSKPLVGMQEQTSQQA
jgi:hypothetical protein